MKFINILTLILLIVGGLNWGLVGLFNFDLVAAIFGAGSMLSLGSFTSWWGSRRPGRSSRCLPSWAPANSPRSGTGSLWRGRLTRKRPPPPLPYGRILPAHDDRLWGRELRRGGDRRDLSAGRLVQAARQAAMAAAGLAIRARLDGALCVDRRVGLARLARGRHRRRRTASRPSMHCSSCSTPPGRRSSSDFIDRAWRWWRS